MLRVGLAERTLELLRAAVADEETVARFRAKVLAVPGMDCLIFTGAVSGRGHGRFWLGHADHRDIVVIAHRFAFALEHGIDSLLAVPVLGHRCDNPLCQRIGPGHVEPRPVRAYSGGMRCRLDVAGSARAPATRPVPGRTHYWARPASRTSIR